MFALPQLSFQLQPLFQLMHGRVSLLFKIVGHAIEFPFQQREFIIARWYDHPIIEVPSAKSPRALQQVIDRAQQAVSRHDHYDQDDNDEQ